MQRRKLPKSIPAVKVEDPPEEELGPAMQACEAMQRRFVVAYCMCGDATAAARAAGYSDVGEGAKVRGCEALRKPKIIEAIREWSTGALKGRGVFVAIETLIEIASDKAATRKDRVAAADSLLDRAGVSKQTIHNVNVEHSEGPSTDDLVAALEVFAEKRRAKALLAPIERAASAAA